MIRTALNVLLKWYPVFWLLELNLLFRYLELPMKILKLVEGTATNILHSKEWTDLKQSSEACFCVH